MAGKNILLQTPGEVLDGLCDWEDSLLQACQWLTNKAQIKTGALPAGTYRHARHVSDWRGALWGEYAVATRRWDFMCPTWHTSQAVKALALAHQVMGQNWLIESARQGAAFVLRCQKTDGPDAGLILAYEDHEDKVNTSALLEALDGLFVLSDVCGDASYRTAAVAAGRWAMKRAWIQGKGIVKDLYDPATQQFIDPAYVTLSPHPGRPLADDAVWLTCHQLTGEPAFREAFYDVLDCLLRTEHPAGNWVGYGPCHPRTSEIHPRHAYWWGLPMVMAWRESGEQRYLDAACRSGEWYINAQRTDGGLFRYTDDQFKTACFGHATSGSLCAAILWLELWQCTGDAHWLQPAFKSLQYARAMQFTRPADENLAGCILEKVLPPDGSDASPYHIRDLATIFYVQALAKFHLAAHASDRQSMSPLDIQSN